MNNKILAKCATDKLQLRDRLERGARYIEIHLRDSEPSDLNEVKAMNKNLQESGLKPLVIHAPMSREYILESLGNKDADKRMHLVSKMAQEASENHGMDVVVVVHQELSLDQLQGFGIIDRVSASLEKLLSDYPNVKYGLENLSLVNKEGDNFISHSSFYDEPVRVAEYLKSRLKTRRIGTVLDTCHALSSIRILKLFEQYGHHSDICLEQYIEDYADTLFLVHLSNAESLGIGSGHGVDFETNEDKILLHHILSKLSSVGYTGPITLEVNEENILFAKRYSSLREKIRIRVNESLS